MAQITCDSLSKRYGSVRALEGVSCVVPSGTVTMVMGSSGSGKTTLLRIIAGLERPDTGTVVIDGRLVSEPNFLTPPHKRGLAFVFQRPTLWPHMNAVDNVALALVGNGLRRRGRRVRAEAELTRLGMASRLRAYPGTLSGGEMQRVSLARALVVEPPMLLLDEPFEGLDAYLRAELVAHLAALKNERGVTIVWVTHRHEETLNLADQVVVLRDGKVIDHESTLKSDRDVTGS